MQADGKAYLRRTQKAWGVLSMPLARIEIEQLESRRWHAEIEAGGLPGGPNLKRVAVNGDSYEAIIDAVTAAYQAQMPMPPPAPRVAAGARLALSVPDEDQPDDHDLVRGDIDSGPPASEWNRLHAEAVALGINPDGRWGAARLRREIAAHEAAAADKE